MQNTLALMLVLLSFGTMSTSCQKNTAAPISLTDGPLTATLTVGQTQALGPLSVKVTAIEDRRCAREECSLCYGGYATVQVDVLASGQTPQHVTFKRLSCLGPQDLTLASADSVRAQVQLVSGYRIGLINMTDFVRASPLATSAYSVTFLLEKK